MKRKKLEAALNEVSDSYIRQAAEFQKKRRLAPWLGAVAAVLAVAIIAGALWRPAATHGTETLPTLHDPAVIPITPGASVSPGVHLTYAIASPVYPKLCGYPLEEEMGSYEQWWDDQRAMHDQPDGYADSLHSYFSRSVSLLLGNTGGQNAVCSPLNIYMALAMLAEVTDGDSRGQILELLNADSIESLREQAGHVWRGHYNDDGLTTSILGSSLWVDSDYTCIKETAQLLAESYFASVYSGDLGTAEMNEALHSWLSEQTGGMLDEYVNGVQMDALTVLALASTIYYQVQWTNQFHEEANTEGTFHGTAGDTTETFMNRLLLYGPYYWSDHFGAVALSLEDGSAMWLFLPDEGVTPEQLMSSGEIFDFLAQDPDYYQSSYQNKKSIKVNLSLPKFDIAAQTGLVEQLKALGVTDVFEAGTADFSPIIAEEDGGYVSEILHATRVAVDEDGVTAAAFTVIMRAGAAMPPEDEIDFVLDRPFAFLIESQDGLPLFAGIVNRP